MLSACCLFIALRYLTIVNRMVLSELCCVLDLTDVASDAIPSILFEKWLQILHISIVVVVF